MALAEIKIAVKTAIIGKIRVTMMGATVETTADIEWRPHLPQLQDLPWKCGVCPGGPVERIAGSPERTAQAVG